MKQNDILTLKITDYGSNAEGIAKEGEYTCFVNNALDGEVVQAKVSYVKNKTVFADCINVISPSLCRVKPLCPYYYKCGGCDLQIMTYAEQLEFKRRNVARNFRKIGGIDLPVPTPEPSPLQLGYRNKLSLPYSTLNGKTVCGFYEKDSHRIVPMDKCILEGSWAEKIASIVKEYMDECNVPAYNEADGTGIVRHVVVRHLFGQTLITIVANSDELPDCNVLVGKLQKSLSSFGLFFNVNKARNNVILGGSTKHLFGREYISGENFGVKFHLKPDSFYQVNDNVKDIIYSQVRQLLSECDTEVLIDAFSGIGLLSGALYSPDFDTYAIEIEQSAVSDANDMKELNGLDRLTNICGDVDEELKRIAGECFGKRVSLVVDPPRKGLSESTIQTILDIKPQNIVYISCDSATLARDLSRIGVDTSEYVRGRKVEDNLLNAQTFGKPTMLNQDRTQLEYFQQDEYSSSVYMELAASVKEPSLAPYELTHLQLFDMFPQTKHIETLVCLTRK